MTKKLHFTLHEPDNDAIADLAQKAKRTFMWQAEQAFHNSWQQAEDWIKTGKVGKKEITVTIHVADIEYKAEPPKGDAA